MSIQNARKGGTKKCNIKNSKGSHVLRRDNCGSWLGRVLEKAYLRTKSKEQSMYN